MKSGMRTTFHFICIAIATAIIAVSAVSISGCSPETKHEVLTFFFTGVPDPFAELVESDEIIGVKTKKKKRHVFFQEPRYYIHGPYAAGECGKCHSADSAKQFRIGSGKTTKTSTQKRKRFGPRLAYPLEKLCVTCHTDKSETFARSLQLSVHEPAATGMCVKCHDPHRSARQYMLLGKNSVELCTVACHDKDGFQQRGAHRKNQGKDCLECHNPHVGTTAQLLRSDYDEWQQFDGVN